MADPDLQIHALQHIFAQSIKYGPFRASY